MRVAAAVLGGNYDQARTLANEKLEEVKALFSGSCPLSRGQYRQLQPGPFARDIPKVTTDCMSATVIESAPASAEPTVGSGNRKSRVERRELRDEGPDRKVRRFRRRVPRVLVRRVGSPFPRCWSL